MPDLLTRFLGMSAVLTGYTGPELQGTGLSQAYCSEVQGTAGEPALIGLIVAFEAVMAGPDSEREARMQAEVFDNASHGPLATNIMRLWLTGGWTGLGNAWHEANGGDPQDPTRVVSGAAYREGLVWPNIASHPQGAKQPGFATWAFPPAPFEEV